MVEEIKEDNNCIIKAFENNPISILHEDINDKKVYCFKASDIGKALKLSNIAVSIQSYDEDEKVLRKAYDLRGCEQNTLFLTSQGVYRLLYNSKKEGAKKFRKWAGNILDDIIFNESIELKKQLEETDKLHKLELLEQIDKNKTEVLLTRERALIESHRKQNVFYMCLFKYQGKLYVKFGISEGSINLKGDILNRINSHKNEITKDLYLVHIIKIENCKELENRFKQNVVTIEKAFTNNEIKTEIIELTQTITIESTINISNKLSKIQPTFNNTLELELTKEKTKQMEMEIELRSLQLKQQELLSLQEKLELTKEKTKQMELEFKLLELKLQVESHQDVVIESRDFTFDDKIKNYLKNNLEKVDNAKVNLDTIFSKLELEFNTNIKVIDTNILIKYVKEIFNIKYIKYNNHFSDLRFKNCSSIFPIKVYQDFIETYIIIKNSREKKNHQEIKYKIKYDNIYIKFKEYTLGIPQLIYNNTSLFEKDFKECIIKLTNSKLSCDILFDGKKARGFIGLMLK